MNILNRALPALLLIVPLSALSAFAQEDETLVFLQAKELDRTKLEAAFAKKMTGATLVGSFTVDGKTDGKAPKAERYELGDVKKIKGDTWLFTAKMKYGKRDVKIAIPLMLTVKWAGDTPVITMTDFGIPGMGTFTARVLFYGDRYVGTWQHGKVGGHMFGKIERAKKTSKSPKRDTAAKPR
jgi:hypothetical protein